MNAFALQSIRRDRLEAAAEYSEIPERMTQAIISAEDEDFFKHGGVDFKGLARAVYELITTGHKKSGGSTITMQVARNFFLSKKKTYLRKLNEIVLSYKIEHQISKEEILALYLNKIFLGYRSYGAAAAAQTYYGKPLKSLSLDEFAMIGGLPKAPSRYNPIYNPQRAKLRRDYVLRRMFENHYITEEEMSRRKLELEREVDFYGAMDGASKFVSGNVKVGILITIVNIVGGLVVGTTVHGESLTSAVNTYVSLTVGDGLVSQFPALFISTATGLIVTRAVSDGTFADDVSEQFSAQSRIYWIAAVFLFILSLLPGFPWYVLIPMGVLSAMAGLIIGRRQTAEAAAAEQKERSEAAQEERPAEISPVAPLDPISLELGYGLVPLVDKEKGAELLDRITGIRREAALDLGLVVPRIRIIDNMRLEPSEYCVKIRGVEVGRGQIRMGRYLSINPGGTREDIPGEETRDPAFGLPAKWIAEEQREDAERAGYTVVDAPSIVATHLTEIIKRHAHEILGRQEVRSMLDTLRQDYPAVVEEVQGVLGVGEIQKVLQGLLREQVSIRNMVVILEALADYATVTKDTGFLVEKVRQAVGRQISLQYAGDERVLRVLTIEPGLEQEIIDSRVETSSGVVSALPPDRQRGWIQALSTAVSAVQEQGHLPVVLCSEAARPLVKRSTERELRDLAVLSIPEIVPDIRVESLGEIRIEEQ